MRRAAAVLALLAACVAALSLGAAGDEGAGGTTYRIEFDNAFGLSEGGDFRVAGVRVGETTGFEIAGQARPRAVVEAELTEPGAAALRADAHCEIRPQSLIGEYYVDCQPGAAERRLPDGGRVPVEQTSSTIPVDLVNNVMRRPYRERLRLIVEELGAGLAGRPEDLSAVLRRAHPGLRETSETLRILGRQTETIKRFIGDADTVVAALEARKSDVTRFVREAGETAEVSASRRDELARSFDRLPVFLGELRPYMARLGDLTRAQTPVLRNLEAASDELQTFLVRLRPFAEEGLPAFEALGEASAVGSRAVRATRAELVELRRLARDAPGFARPLRQLLQTIDDRDRAVEPDPRAAATGPPAGDKTHVPEGRQGGFTGMEAIWNYFFWQTLTTNNMDQIGKVLRLSTFINECTPYTVKPSPELLAECTQALGPTQPGVTTPDPTRPGAAAAAASAGGSPTAPGVATPPAPFGSPTPGVATPPAPFGAPPAAAPNGAAPQAPAAPGDDPATPLLDYLLAP